MPATTFSSQQRRGCCCSGGRSSNSSSSSSASGGRRARAARRAAAAAAAAPGTSSGDAVAVQLIASDVDGTLLNSQQKLTPAVQSAVRRAADAGVPLFVATGKARGPWLDDVLPKLGLTLPGVFLQGLLVATSEGEVLYSRALPDDVVLDCIRLAAAANVTLTAYTHGRIFAAALDEHTDRLLFYREPTPEAVGDMESFLLGGGRRSLAVSTTSTGTSDGSSGSADGSSSSSSGADGDGSSSADSGGSSGSLQDRVAANKLIFLAAQPAIDALRPRVEAALAGRASLTVALSGMLEVLPLGASKGAGVAWLLQQHLGRGLGGLMALGDGENDVEMLRLAAGAPGGVGVAMANANARVKAAASALAPSNDDDGVAAAIERFVLAPRGLATAAAAAEVATTTRGLV